jgi:hypothetical protein
MNSLRLCFVASTAMLCVLAVASQASAKSKGNAAGRDAAIQKCVLQAVTEYPRGPDSNDSARTASYKACMTTAGYRP